MNILEYMSYAEVRAMLGVATTEVTDTQLGLDIYVDTLQISLLSESGIYSPDTTERTLDGHYTYLGGLASPTDGQVQLKLNIRLYALYTVVGLVADVLSMVAPKAITDGKSSAVRFSPEATFKGVMAAVRQKRDAVLALIREDLGITVADRIYLKAAAPAVDVVTNAAYE